jgi:hypothetical protein
MSIIEIFFLFKTSTKTPTENKVTIKEGSTFKASNTESSEYNSGANVPSTLIILPASTLSKKGKSPGRSTHGSINGYNF